ncbi:unnamed protein product [Didymodactylos carnosus]|uniref:Uncharacterized protein n=1 Tax=Didymodactylos carnosus TaxID=1234261 RepID=A0A813WLZ7_9BILA|nr:unnamed protein product [Didymodactylos carnosus]CAF1662653.1 unnamed protein product [Didymodactylos carnosus]CAF3646961.1 unnamed protein product [Didymodactylos carnosus]CAF4522729.1 unnamed protein product [Didymodactylos carnosus]
MQPVRLMEDDLDPINMNRDILFDRNSFGRYLKEAMTGQDKDDIQLAKRIIMLPRVGKRSISDHEIFKIQQEQI